MKIKCISIRQPWANLIGLKIIETRSWKTDYRGPLAIHASQKPDMQAYEALKKTDVEEFFGCKLSLEPRGAIISVTHLTDITEFNDQKHFEEYSTLHLVPYGFEKYGWWLLDEKKVKRLDNPIPYKGKLGLFDVKIPDSVISAPLR